MGMYTELVLKCCIKDDVPEDVRTILDYLFNTSGDFDNPPPQPDHPFFKSHRWVMVGQCSSFYHHPKALSDYWMGHDGARDRGGYIFSRSDLKNYDNEINLFIDWLRPYIDEEDEQCIGWSWYEEDYQPTLIFKKEPA